MDKQGIGPASVRTKVVRTVEGEAAVGGVPDRVVLEVVRGAEAGEDKYVCDQFQESVLPGCNKDH